MDWRFCWVVVLGVGCADSDDGTGSEAGTTSVSSVSESSAESSEASSGATSTSVGESSSEAESGTTGAPTSCAEATDVTTCMAAGHDTLTCVWLVSTTVVGGGDSICEPIDVGPTGVCAIDEQDDGCGVPEPTCPDDFTAVWYREVGLEVGAIELVAFEANDVCDGPGGGFMPCQYDAQAGTFMPPECSCGCPMGR